MRMKPLWLALSLALMLLPKLALAQVEIGVVVPSVRVNMAPPPMRVEVQPVRPSAGYVWIAGHWVWEGGAHVWVGGHWAMPPSAYHRWVPARWENRGGAWYFTTGHWQYNAPQTVSYEQPVGPEVIVQQAPPTEIVEVQPAAPWAGAFWVKGHWYWNGVRYQWAGGHWERPRAGWRWEHAHWEPRGGRYVFVGGRWLR